jgi:hypothetical protein
MGWFKDHGRSVVNESAEEAIAIGPLFPVAALLGTRASLLRQPPLTHPALREQHDYEQGCRRSGGSEEIDRETACVHGISEGEQRC